eukprot:4390874-Pleurochrysis_carterae.AAC.1
MPRWPSSLSDQEIRAPLPEGPSARRPHLPSPPAGERHERATHRDSAPAMPGPEDPCTVGTLSEWPLSPPPPRLDRMTLIALGSGDPRTQCT